MGSELDLHTFARFTVEDPVSEIIKRFSEDKILRHHFALKGSLTFQNHSNILSPDRTTEMNISNPRRSERLRATANETMEASSESLKLVVKSFRPRADQFCGYNISGGERGFEHRMAALVIEYKAPHKLTSGHISEELTEIK